MYASPFDFLSFFVFCSSLVFLFFLPGRKFVFLVCSRAGENPKGAKKEKRSVRLLVFGRGKKKEIEKTELTLCDRLALDDVEGKIECGASPRYKNITHDASYVMDILQTYGNVAEFVLDRIYTLAND